MTRKLNAAKLQLAVTALDKRELMDQVSRALELLQPHEAGEARQACLMFPQEAATLINTALSEGKRGDQLRRVLRDLPKRLALLGCE